MGALNNIETPIGSDTYEFAANATTKEDIQKVKNDLDKQRELSIDERVDETFGDLIGKSFDNNEIINLMYMSENGKKENCKFDLSNQILEYMGNSYKIELPSGAKLNNVEFLDNEIKIEGKVGWFKGEGKASYAQMIKSFDDAFKNGSTTILLADNKKMEINRV